MEGEEYFFLSPFFYKFNVFNFYNLFCQTHLVQSYFSKPQKTWKEREKADANNAASKSEMQMEGRILIIRPNNVSDMGKWVSTVLCTLLIRSNILDTEKLFVNPSWCAILPRKSIADK